MATSDDDLGKMLEQGWVIKGYSTAMMAAGAMVHSVLLQKDNNVSTVTIVVNGVKEVGRTTNSLSPIAEAKGGFWG